MTNRTKTLTALATRAEQAGVEEQRALLQEASAVIAGCNWPFAKALRFQNMLRAQAFTDAAMMLLGEGDAVSGERMRLEWYNTNGVLAEHVRASAWVPGAPRCYATTPALALLAAICKAVAQGEG